mgnify:FL=1|jgi:cell division protein FtsB|tara:strand:+ start:1335 stop:1694 length:360 start_codon:yes stop_codon:yes gene_type:complete
MFRLVEFFRKVGARDFRFYTAISLLLLIVFFTQNNIWFGDQSRADLKILQEEIVFLEEEKLRLKNENKLLNEEKIKLSSGRETIEGLARSELGLIKPGEKFYIFEDKDSEQKPTKSELN